MAWKRSGVQFPLAPPRLRPADRSIDSIGILKQHGFDPAPQRTSVTWTQFLRSQAAVACDFVTVDTVLLRRCYLLFFIDVTNREVLYGGITANPTGAWTTQTARNLFVRPPNRFTPGPSPRSWPRQPVRQRLRRGLL